MKLVMATIIFLKVTLGFSSTIGYGYSYVMTSKQELVYMGFLIGLKKTIKKNFHRKNVILKKSTEKSAMDPYYIAKYLQKKSDIFVVGFPTSHEALMAASALKGQNKIFISAAAKSSKLNEIGPNIFSVNSSNDDSVNSSLSFLQNKLKLKNGVMISNPHNAFSDNLDSIYRKKIKNNKKFKIETILTDKKGDLTEEQLKKLRKTSNEFIIINTYVQKSHHILEYLKNLKKKVPIIANSSWAIDGIQEIKRFLSETDLEIYGFEVITKSSKEYALLKSYAKKEYGVDVAPHLVYGFDLGVVVASILNRINGPITYQNALKTIKQNPCFFNTTANKLCLSKNGGTAFRTTTIGRFDKTRGFVKINYEK